MIPEISFFFMLLLGSGASGIPMNPVLDDNFIGKEQICSLTNMAPYYDCSTQWTIFMYDDEFTDTCNQNVAVGLAAKACTMYVSYDNKVLSADIHLGIGHDLESEHPFPGGPEYQSILYHELQHATCGCNWHTEIVDFIN